MGTNTTQKRGRPSLGAHASNKRLVACCTQAELERAAAAASKLNVTLADFIRDAVNAKASEVGS